MKLAAHWHLLRAALCLGSLTAAALETCSQEEPSLQHCEDSRDQGAAVHFLQTDRSRRLEESASVPGFLPDIEINLDLPPRDRFREWARWMVTAHGPDDPRMPLIDGVRTDPFKLWRDAVMPLAEQQEWLEVVKNSVHPDQMEELRGIEEEYAIAMQASGRPLPFATTTDKLLLNSILYELAYPDLACSGILVALPNGTVIHGRNMDYWLYGVNGNNNLTQKVTYMRGGKPLFTSITMDLPMTVHTGMRFGGWSIEINTHTSNNRLVNLQSGKAGGKTNGWTIRHLMDTVPDFETAVLRMRETIWAAPHYLIAAGAGPNEGAVLTLHRRAPDATWSEALYPQVMVVEHRLSPATGFWYMVQTNDEAWEQPDDNRRPFEQSWLEARGPDGVTAEDIMQLIRTPPARQSMTLFSFVMVPATNYSELIISKHVALG